MASVAHALTTTAKVKTYLGISSSDYDTVIDAAVSYATDVIESYCGKRRFKSTTYTNEVYDAEGQSELLLEQWPVTSLTAISYRSGPLSSPTWTAFTTDEYMLYGERGTVGFLAPLPNVRQGIRATYVAGYLIDFTNELTATHTLPFDICLVATELAAKLTESRKAVGVQSMATEGQSVTFAADAGGSLTDAHKNILKRYLRRVA